MQPQANGERGFPIKLAKTPLLVSRALTVVALVLWVISLSQVALIVDTGSAKPDVWRGADILLMGWLAILEFAVGWYANPPLLFAAIVLLTSQKLPWKTTIFALVLALDTFRLQSLPGEGRAGVYAYGVGLALWFAAIGVLLLAIAWRRAELLGRVSILASMRTPAVMLTLATIVCAGIFYGFQAHQATQTLSVSESKFIPMGGVTLGDVCKKVVLLPATQILLDGPLEIRGEAYPLSSPETLLRWGIPVVRKGGFDFTLTDANDINSMYWKPASGSAAATLHLSTAKNDTIEAALKSVDGKATIFHQTWSRDRNKSSLYCPDYRNDDPSSPPRSLLTAALDVPGGVKPPALSAPRNTIDVAPYRKEDLPMARTLETRTNAATSEPPRNAGCTSRVRFVDKDEPGYRGPQTFAVDERHYSLENNQPLAAVCADDSIYLYYFWYSEGREPYLLYIQRREMSDFRKAWTLVTRFDYSRAESFNGGQRTVSIRSVRENANTVVAEIVDVAHSRVIDISFNVPNQ